MGILLYTEGSVLGARQTTGTILRTGWVPTFLAGIGPAHSSSQYDSFLSKEVGNSPDWAEESTRFPGLISNTP